MKIIDLLNKIANGEEVPKHIIINDSKYVFSCDDGDYYNVIDNAPSLYEIIWRYNALVWLNLEVEIIEEAEETQKIPRLSFQQIGSNNLEKGNYFRFVEDINKQIGGLGKKINDLIDEVNELKGGLNGNQS